MLVEGLTTVETARRLGVSAEEVYQLLFAGELEGGPDSDGVVRVPADALTDYQNRHPRSDRHASA